jgi:hypothetical protein
MWLYFEYILLDLTLFVCVKKCPMCKKNGCLCTVFGLACKLSIPEQIETKA